jgi:hypothetical protein
MVRSIEHFAMDTSLERRRFLKIMAGAAGFLNVPAPLLNAAEPRGSLVNWGRVKFASAGTDQGNWGVHPQGDLNLVDFLSANSSLQISNKWNVADVAKIDELVKFPFLYMHSEDTPALDDAARANIREYLLRGGFLFAEDCVIGRGTHGRNTRNDFFFLGMMDELSRIMPEAKLERLPNDHPVFHTAYHMKNGMPHMQGTPHGLYGLTLNGRVLALLSPSDLHCGWTNGYRWFGAEQVDLAMKMGTNIYLFAMTQEA